jgi:hypothetical protein
MRPLVGIISSERATESSGRSCGTRYHLQNYDDVVINVLRSVFVDWVVLNGQVRFLHEADPVVVGGAVPSIGWLIGRLIQVV